MSVMIYRTWTIPRLLSTTHGKRKGTTDESREPRARGPGLDGRRLFRLYVILRNILRSTSRTLYVMLYAGARCLDAGARRLDAPLELNSIFRQLVKDLSYG